MDEYPLHTLWSLAVDQPGYNKELWKLLQAKLQKALKDSAELAELKKEKPCLQS